MHNANPPGTSQASRLIEAPREAIYHACTDPAALAAWQAPGDMTARVLAFDLRVGGGYRMALSYPLTDPANRGKSSDREDRYSARFVELTPPGRIVKAIRFESDDAAFAGEMTMTITLDEAGDGTLVTIAFANIPPGIRPEDNAEGTRLSLEKLARLVEARPDA